MLDALMNYLNGFTDIPFVELAWSHSPDEKYGVVTLDNQIALDADADPVSEKMLTGFVDVFVKKPKDLSTVSDVESALKRLGIYFALNSVQFEDDTGYVHYEWTWRDTTNIVSSKLYVIKFYGLNGLISEQILPYGTMPNAPQVTDEVVGGLTYSHFDWDAPIAPASKNADYNATYRIIVTIVRRGGGNIFLAMNGEERMTAAQVAIIVEWFNGGNAVGCAFVGSITNASEVTTEYVIFSTIRAVW